MPILSLKAARELEASFKGRITSWHEAHAEFRGQPSVLIPESAEDVGRALRLARAAGRRVFVRSGRNVSATDVGKTPAADAAIVSMEEFRHVDIKNSRVIVGAAATTADVAEKLFEQQLFLPLGDNPTQSIVSAALSMDASPFLRSGAGLGALADSVLEAEVIPTMGPGAGKPKMLQKNALRELLAGDRSAVITRLIFDAGIDNTSEPDRWTLSWMVPYERKAFAKLCDSLFSPAPREGSIPAGVDLSVRATSAAFAMKLIIVRATGHGDADNRTVQTVIEAALQRAKLSGLTPAAASGPGSSVAAWVATGPNLAAADEVLRRYGSNAAPRSYEKVREKFLAAVEFTIGTNTRTGRKHATDVRGWAELQLAASGQVVARAELSDENADPKVAQEARRIIAAAIPADKASPTAPVSSRAVVRRSPARAIMRDAEVLPTVTPTLNFELPVSSLADPALMPGFRGDLYQATSGLQYQRAIRQYAVTSYSPAVVAARMTPRYVAAPLDAADVATAVTYAAANGLKVVTRSGGHQYCGLSSGGNNTLLLEMNRFNKVVFSPATGTPTRVTVGPSVALRDLSQKLYSKGVVIPHGECPLVRLGGHVQSGGIGHQLRSLGAALDWVSSFKMVTRDPNAAGDLYVERQFTRPTAGANSGPPDDRDVFRAVLGGGPSSWGVLTEVTFDLVSDSKYPASRGYSRTYLYEKDGFKAAMQQMQKWVGKQAQGSLPNGVDLFISVVSGDFEQTRPGALLVETMSRDSSGSARIKEVVTAVDSNVSLLSFTAAELASPIKGAAPMSRIAHKGVREIGVFGLPPSGREFDLPYKKSLHITTTQFSPNFVDRFVDLVDNVYRSSGMKVVVQAVVGGGEFAANSQTMATHMQRRNGLAQLVFDVFYEQPGDQAAAVQFQKRMKALLQDYSGGADIRMAWGTFEDADAVGDQLDMRRQEVQDLYYDSRSEYARLKEIKNYTDPRDLFHTSFTVQ